MMKRSAKYLALLALATTACSSAAGNDASGPAANNGGIVISYNTPTEWANWGEVLRAFTAQTAITAPNDPKNSGQTLAALQAEAAAPASDVAYYGIVFGYQAQDASLVQPYQPPGFDKIPDALKSADGNWFAVHQGAVAMIINTDELGDTPAPQCWKDLLDPKYSGKVGYLDPTQAAVGYSVLTAANLGMGGSLDNPAPGLDWAKKMVANKVANPAQTATAMVQQGEIPILIDADFNGYKLAAEGSPISVIYPCEGTISIPYVMSLVKGGPHPEQGKKLLDFVLSEQAQTLFAKSYLRPVLPVELPAEAADVFPANYDTLVTTPDFAKMRQAQDEVIKRYAAEVTS